MTLHMPSGLFTDFYELTMAQVYWQNGVNRPATFSFFFRNYPGHRAFFVAAGLEDVLTFLEDFHFTPGDLDFLRSLNRFDPRFLDYLATLRFTGSVRAMPEGTIFFTNEPVVEVTGPVIEAQIVETLVMNQVHMQSVLAGKAARARLAAGDHTLIDFAARRAHGIDAANKLARTCFLVGFDGTSNAAAGAMYGIPLYGTMAHSFITCFASELASFRAFSRSFPGACTLLIDTYDTLAGARKAVAIADEMRARGHALSAVRLDSGDLLDLSRKCRALLNEAGHTSVQIVASGGLDEFEIEALLAARAPIDVFCAGTKVGVSADAPMADCAYKLVEYDGRPVLKLSPQKQTLPGRKQVHRFYKEAGSFQRDMIARAEEPCPPGATALLREVMREGKRSFSPAKLHESRTYCRKQLEGLPGPQKILRSPEHYEVNISPPLIALTEEIARETRARELP
jgi:nicotinate phosphoribosyltransferase